MNYRKYIMITGVATVLLGASSCKKYLNKLPLDTITSEAFYTTGTQVQQALTGVYSAYGARTISPGFANPTTYYAKMDLHTEIGLERGLNGTIGSGAYNPSDGTIRELWAGFYQVIQRSNSLLFNMTKAQSSMDPGEYARVQAEAKVLRASAYWYLMVYFGDVPFFTGPLEQSDFFSATRKPRKDIVDFLVADLKAAAPVLAWLPTEQGRVSRGVALGTAARIAMVDRRYQEVITLTNEIIATSPYNLNPSFQNLFRKAGQTTNANNEIMFIYPYGDADGGSFNYLNLVQGSRNQGGQSSHFPSQFLVDLFECADGRTIDQSPLYDAAQPTRNRDPRMKQTVIVPGDTVIVQGFTSNVFTSTNFTIFSYNTATNTISPTSTSNIDSSNLFGPRLNGCGNLWRKYVNDRDINGTAANLYKVGWVYMRFSEILLLNAEAKLESGAPAAEVAIPVNRVRTRAGMPNVDAATLANPAALKQLVRREKTVEFANEGIHIADMRRWDNGAYAAKVMAMQIYGEPFSRMSLVAGKGLVINNPAPIPVFDPVYNVPVTWPNGDATRLKRELRIFNNNQHILCPIPQNELDKVPSLVQNQGW
jgi:starch-binding outer membrane protein, SusD/RagB family